ncbi:MAG: hypothetical protein ACQET3_12975 [Promethearchaeati archaeon]
MSVHVRFFNESGQVVHREFVIQPEHVETGSMNEIGIFQVTGGLYQVNLTSMHYQDGSPTGEDPLLYELSQQLSADHLDELFNWSTLLFLVVLGGGVYVLGGYAVDLGSVRKPDIKPAEEKEFESTYEEYLRSSMKKEK